MFGYYKNGFKQKPFTEIFDIYRLASYIKDHPFKERITELRKLPYKSEEYSYLKENLPSITPHALFRNSKEISELVQLSGYLYFDIDADDFQCDVEELRRQLTGIYKQYIYMAGLSVGGRGLFFYVKVNGITTDNFDAVFEYYRNGIFKDLPTDNNAKGITRNQIIPFDQQLYYNPDCVMDLPDISNSINGIGKKKGTLSVKDKRERCYTLSVPFFPIDKVLADLRFETEFNVGDNVFTVEPIDYYKIYFPNRIVKGKKHKTFRAITQGMMFLNPDVSLIYIQSYIHYINQNHTTIPMKTKEMVRTVEHEYSRIKETGKILLPLSVKSLHFNKSIKIPTSYKRTISNKVNGLIKRYRSVKLIADARERLLAAGSKATDKNIALATGLSEKTVRRNKHFQPTDIAVEIIRIHAAVREELTGGRLILEQ